MTGYISQRDTKRLLSYAPKDLDNFKGNFIEDVYPLCFGSANDEFLNIVKKVIKGLEIKTKEFEAALYQFKNVGMHTDCISGDEIGSLLIVLHGEGSLSYFKGEKEYKQKDVGVRCLSKGMVFFLDDKLPHSFILTSDDPCVCCIVELPKKDVPDYFK